MSEPKSSNPGNQLWGIYHAPDHARIEDQDLRTVIKARTQIAAEETAASLGFDEPLARPVTRDVARRAQWLPTQKGRSVRRNASGIRV